MTTLVKIKKTYVDRHGVRRCVECWRPTDATVALANEALYLAAKRALAYFETKARGGYQSPYEDVFAGRELAAAIQGVETPDLPL